MGPEDGMGGGIIDSPCGEDYYEDDDNEGSGSGIGFEGDE
jgi:hypothetical protein